MLASKSLDGNIYCWNHATGKIVTTLDEPAYGHYASITFHPKQPVLATLGQKDRIVRIWNVHINAHLPAVSSATYVNARVVLLGDRGAGKTSLSLALRNQPHVSPESSHGRNIDIFHNEKIKADNATEETREIFLLDLAGQEHYRHIHAMNVEAADLALVLFNIHNDTNPFSSVRYW